MSWPYRRKQVGEETGGQEPSSFDEVLSQAPLATDSVKRVTDYQAMPNLQSTAGSPVFDLADAATSNIPKSKLDVVLQAAPMLGVAAWKARGVPKSVIQELRNKPQSRIDARDTMFHTTDPRGFNGILDSGEIHHSIGSGGSRHPGVSLSRVPEIPTMDNVRAGITFELDSKKIPKYKPHVGIEGDEGGFGKTVTDLFNPESEPTMNPGFEFESRVQGKKSVPLSAAKSILINRPSVEAFTGEGFVGGGEPGSTDRLIEEVKKKAAEKKLPVKVFHGNEIQSYRARIGHEKK